MPGKEADTVEEVLVEASDNIFQELGNNDYNYRDLVSELIDNAVAARVDGEDLKVTVEVRIDSEGNPVRFVIRDNASGIAADLLGKAIAPAAIQTTGSLNEHGLGMKQAVAALGTLEHLKTKCQGEETARKVTEFRFGKLPVHRVDWENARGTEISVVDLKPIVVSTANHISRDLIPYLGARYRRFLNPTAQVMELALKLVNEETDEVTHAWNVEPVKPTYFHPSTRNNKPVIEKYVLEGDDWKARLTFGYAPSSRAEWEELGLEKPSKFHPYNVSLSKQGLDVLLHDRVILFHQLADIDIIESSHNDYNTIRGEIDLVDGFATAITKNRIIEDENFRECIAKIRHILKGEEEGPQGKKKDYLKTKEYPEQLPESLLRDRLKEWLRSNPVQPRDDVEIEYVVEGVEGYIDILADGEAWELKVDQASALDVYQLFMYMDIGGVEKGFLVASDFTTGAKIAKKHLAQAHKKEIALAKREDFPINQHPTDQEREEYY